MESFHSPFKQFMQFIKLHGVFILPVDHFKQEFELLLTIGIGKPNDAREDLVKVHHNYPAFKKANYIFACGQRWRIFYWKK